MDFDKMRGMHDYYGESGRLFNADGEFVGLDEDMASKLELKAFYDVEHAEKDFFTWLEDNFDVLYTADGDDTDFYVEK